MPLQLLQKRVQTYKKSSRGFSLFELVVFCAITALIASMGLVIWREYTTLLVRCECERMFSCMLTAREIIFDSQHNNFVCDGAVCKLAPGVIFGASAEVFGPPSNPAHRIIEPITFAQKKFHVVDGIRSSGTLYLTDESRHVCYAISSAIGDGAALRRYWWNGNSWKNIQ